MKILLLGEYSNVHHTLALGLRALGHSVMVASDGDLWKDYPRDIDLTRRSALQYAALLAAVMPRLRGYDVVQLMNPVFLNLRAERIMPFYRYLRRHNGAVVMAAYGMDHFWVRLGDECRLRYSDFNFGSTLRHYPDAEQWRQEWAADGAKGLLNRRIADDCDAIVSGLYEYDAAYRPHYGDKTTFIPFPIIPRDDSPHHYDGTRRKRFFIGIQRERSAYKGTDIMLRALEQLKAQYPDEMDIIRAENVPFARYCQMLDGSDIILDQLYSYTPAMNALQAMSQGLIVVGGGEPENYDILHEHTLRPIVNVQPNEQSVFAEMEARLIGANADEIGNLQRQSVEYILRHHSHIKVARQYAELYERCLTQR